MICARFGALTAPLALVAAALGLHAGPLAAQALADLDSVIPALMEEHEVPGLALAVVKDGELIALRGFGRARVADNTGVDPERTMFRLASVAKLFVATVLVELAERGDVDLDADIRTYVPDIPIPDTYEAPITLHHLLTHTAGFDERLIGYAARSADEIKPLGEYLAQNLPARGWGPGELVGYSNHGMALAGYIAESVTGRPFHELAREILFSPLGMSRTSYREISNRLEADLAVGHDCRDDVCTPEPEIFSHPYPVGLAFTTAADMARFLTAQLGRGRIDGVSALSARAIDRVQSEQYTHDPALPGMSYGFFNQVVRGHRALAHAGSVPGLGHLLLMVPDQDLGFYFAANGGRSAFGAALRDSLLDRLLEPRVSVDIAPRIDLDSDYLGRFVGSYQLTRYAHYTVEKFPFLFAATVPVIQGDSGRLVLPFPGGSAVFEPVDSLRFREVEGERMIVFRSDETGAVTHLFAGMPAFGSELPAALERLPWYDEPRFKNEYVSWLLAVPLIALIGVWPIVALFVWWRRRRRGVDRAAKGKGPAVALVAALLFYGLFAVFGFGFIARSTRMLSQSTGIVFGMTVDMRILLGIPYLLAAIFLVFVLFVWQSWRESYWSAIQRILYSALALVGVFVIVFLVRWNYLPPTW